MHVYGDGASRRARSFVFRIVDPSIGEFSRIRATDPSDPPELVGRYASRDFDNLRGALPGTLEYVVRIQRVHVDRLVLELAPRNWIGRFDDQETLKVAKKIYR